jgi:hypothetical protein
VKLHVNPENPVGYKVTSYIAKPQKLQVGVWGSPCNLCNPVTPVTYVTFVTLKKKEKRKYLAKGFVNI